MTGKTRGDEMRFCNYCETELVPQIDLGYRPIVNDLSKHKNCRPSQHKDRKSLGIPTSSGTGKFSNDIKELLVMESNRGHTLRSRCMKSLS